MLKTIKLFKMLTTKRLEINNSKIDRFDVNNYISKIF